ncbi:hypothetical protein VNI00_018134 [Paramarasmius palmivorus]|uniref:Uncharacterized protein n=1 Tax=Paramarasmius palmivorus TaxID=297713 RepID=A0AAW0B0A4_9AGAR
MAEKGSTRARTNFTNNDKQIERHKEKYCAAWKALFALVGEQNVNARQLRDKDVTTLDEVDTRAYRNARKVLGAKRRVDEDEDPPLIRPGESKKSTSWIWKSINPEDEPEALTEAVRLEWVKTWARKRRWGEELDLLHEEIGRTCAALRYDASQWRALARKDAALAGAEGRTAFALRQASIRDRLADKFKVLWDSPDPKPKPKGPCEAGGDEVDGSDDDGGDDDDGELFPEEDEEAGTDEDI